MSIYYISNSGDDSLDGLTAETAWQTIPHANANLKGGDELRFRRGDEFFGRIKPPKNADVSKPTRYGDYGDESLPRPVVSQYKIALPNVWEQHGENTWRLNLADTTKFVGNISEPDANVGFIKASGEIYPRKKFELSALEREWDFFSDGGYVYIYAEKNPSELSGDIRLACNIGCMGFTDNLAVSNIDFIGTGGHGISGVVNNAVISRCGFHELGGSQLPGYPTPNTRYGNGVECWSNSSNVTVEHCKFSGIYDVAITMQGDNVVKSWEHMYFRDNVMWNCQQCFEIWSKGDVADTGFVDCRFERNICLDAGYCWGYDVRPNKACSSPLLIYGLGCPLCDITVTENIFTNPRIAVIYKSGGPNDIPRDYKIFGNTIIIPAGRDLCWRERCSDEVYNAFADKIIRDNRVFTRGDYQ